ncbi:putative fungal-specific transcription factor [Aspergillus sclerotiicarbonarius CBS 121057]|uniref:Putative fungal-specific transcription factor n=1 Tax=Aspergillus sclerotiicarbonarius (strain CBS 121057 / IBT 28362) TaxID=1448318 RepID=A0A319DY44_ASPSB|nr:putative fungal-specific transcription factor [Aspergillus sclerotiicarbonarius CBS 121057]
MAPTLEYEKRHAALLTPLRRQRLKISTACQACRSGKVKCDGGRPVPISKAQPKPIVEHTPVRTHTPIPFSPPASRTHSLELRSTVETSTRSEHSSEAQNPDPGPDPDRAYYTAHGRFAGDVAAAIDARKGLTLTTSNRVPFVNAPLFGKADLDLPPNALDYISDLPPRTYADSLVSIYWQHIDPVEPVLDREHFSHNYEKCYSSRGSSQHADHVVWLSILNIVFALAVQRQESTLQQERNEEGNGYFQRAWALVRPETILWTSGSIELVQCLMLMNRYLHCTDNQQKTWMTAGLAMRIAQNMCCRPCSAKDREVKERVWASCIALDRALELHEISNHIQLAQKQTRNSLAARLGLSRLYQQDEYHTVAVQLDACLNKWEETLPSELKMRTLPNVADRMYQAEGYLLHLRLLHTRIYLHRPMLARYSLKSHSTPAAHTSPNRPSLSDRLLQESATMCIEAAQMVTSLILETHDPDDPIGLLPWWYRIYYLHIAGTIFLAAMFSSDLFTTAVSRSWDQVMSGLRAHENLSTYVQQCIETFETLSSRILNTDALPQEGNAGSFFDEFFQDLGFDFDSYLFGTQDVFHTC